MPVSAVSCAQLLQCTYPGQMMHVTLNHLNILKQIGDSEAINLLVGEDTATQRMLSDT